MTTGKWIGLIIVTFLLAGAIADAIRYLQPGSKQKIVIEPAQQFHLTNANELIMAYNANGGIYPGVADVIRKIFYPSTYPCNLCFLAFGNFGKKEAWKIFLEAIPYKKTELHKDEFRRKYQPANFPLPAILLSNGSETKVLVSAAEINQRHTLQGLIQLVQSKLQQY